MLEYAVSDLLAFGIVVGSAVLVCAFGGAALVFSFIGGSRGDPRYSDWSGRALVTALAWCFCSLCAFGGKELAPMFSASDSAGLGGAVAGFTIPAVFIVTLWAVRPRGGPQWINQRDLGYPRRELDSVDSDDGYAASDLDDGGVVEVGVQS